MEKLYAGARIRTLRRTLGLTQTAMAKQANLSTSYLNQLENDQRPLTATVLMSFTKAFSLDSTYFSPDVNARFVADLQEAFTSAGLTDIRIDELHDLANRYPELARGVVHLAHSLADAAATSQASTDFAGIPSVPLQTTPEYVPKAWNTNAFENVRDFFYERRNHIP